jgi:hypothetical protein
MIHRQHFSVVAPWRKSVNKRLFQLGEIVATPAAIEALGKAATTTGNLLDRHASGDWGIISAEDRVTNEDAVKHGSRILSAYRLNDRAKVWIVTEADRSSTCILLPEEY